jgi:hypothetical protein
MGGICYGLLECSKIVDVVKVLVKMYCSYEPMSEWR